jgi:hypothetical protein
LKSLQENEETLPFFPMMTPQEAQALQAHLEAAAAILFKNTPAEQVQDFESIERSVRDQVLEQVSPQIGNFFTQRYRHECRAQAAGRELLGDVDGES